MDPETSGTSYTFTHPLLGVRGETLNVFFDTSKSFHNYCCCFLLSMTFISSFLSDWLTCCSFVTHPILDFLEAVSSTITCRTAHSLHNFKNFQLTPFIYSSINPSITWDRNPLWPSVPRKIHSPLSKKHDHPLKHAIFFEGTPLIPSSTSNIFPLSSTKSLNREFLTYFSILVKSTFMMLILQ